MIVCVIFCGVTGVGNAIVASWSRYTDNQLSFNACFKNVTYVSCAVDIIANGSVSFLFSTKSNVCLFVIFFLECVFGCVLYVCVCVV